METTASIQSSTAPISPEPDEVKPEAGKTGDTEGRYIISDATGGNDQPIKTETGTIHADGTTEPDPFPKR